MILTKKSLIELLQQLDVPDDAPIVSFYNFDESFDFYDKVQVREITSEDYTGPVIAI